MLKVKHSKYTDTYHIIQVKTILYKNNKPEAKHFLDNILYSLEKHCYIQASAQWTIIGSVGLAKLTVKIPSEDKH